MSEDNSLIERIAKYVDRDVEDISKLVSSMSYQDLVLITNAMKRGDEKEVFTILHGYGL